MEREKEEQEEGNGLLRQEEDGELLRFEGVMKEGSSVRVLAVLEGREWCWREV